MIYPFAAAGFMYINFLWGSGGKPLPLSVAFRPPSLFYDSIYRKKEELRYHTITFLFEMIYPLAILITNKQVVCVCRLIQCMNYKDKMSMSLGVVWTGLSYVFPKKMIFVEAGLWTATGIFQGMRNFSALDLRTVFTVAIFILSAFATYYRTTQLLVAAALFRCLKEYYDASCVSDSQKKASLMLTALFRLHAVIFSKNK